MGCLRDNLKYTPPPIEVFKRYGQGLVREADFAYHDLLSSLIEAQLRFVDREKFRAWALEPKYPHDPDLIDVYGSWAMLDDLLRQLHCMDPGERRKHEELDAGHGSPLEKTENGFADLSGRLAAWEIEAGKEFIYPAFNELFKRRLNAWEDNLDKVIRSDFEPTWEFWGTENDYRTERSLLEYTRMGVHILRHCELVTTVNNFTRMEPLPDFKACCTYLDELDKKFREALKKSKRDQIAPWADPSFWWYTPVTPTKKARTKK